MKVTKKLSKLLFGKRKKSGFTIAETVVAIAVISVIILSALSITRSSSTVYSDSLARRDARILADNSLYAFQSCSNKQEFENALGIASKNGFTPDDVGDELTYNASNVVYSYIKKDANNKKVSIYDAAGNVLGSLDYSNAANWNTCTDHLLLSYSQAKISDLYYNLGEVYGDGYLTAAINSGESGNVILKLSKIAILEYAGTTLLGREHYYKITEQPENMQLYFCDAENCFYGSEGGKIYKYVYASYPRSLTGLYASANYPGFSREETTFTDIPATCVYTKQTLSAAGSKAFNLIASCIQGGNGTGSGTIAYEGEIQYVHPTAVNFSAISMDKSSLTENLVDNNGVAIIYKQFSNETDFANRVLALNESDYIDDDTNSYPYAFDYTHKYKAMEWVPVTDYRDVTIKGTATISKYTKRVTSGKTTTTKTYYKLELPFKNGTAAEGATLTYDNAYESVSALKTGSAAAMASDIAKRSEDYIQTSGNYTASLKLGRDKSNQTYTITASASNLYITAKKSGSSTTYYYNPSTKTYTTTKKEFSSKEARSDVLKGFNTNSSYSYPTPSSTSTTFATFEYIKQVESGSHMEEQEVEKEEILRLATVADYSNMRIKTINTATDEVVTYTDDNRVVNKTYTNITEFISAQHALKNSRTFAPTSKYRFINESIFDAIYFSRNSSGGTVNFLDKKGSTIYSLALYSNEDMNAAIDLVKNGSYKPRFKFSGKYYFRGEGNSNYSNNSNFNKNFTYVVDDYAKTIYDETNKRYLKASSSWYGTTYSWQTTSVSLSNKFDSALEFLENGSSPVEKYVYTGSTNQSITVKATVGARMLVFYTSDVEIFSWTFKDDSGFNDAISTYKSSYESTGNGYVCKINDYTLTISISFTENTFTAVVTDSKGRAIYKLNYSKG